MDARAARGADAKRAAGEAALVAVAAVAIVVSPLSLLAVVAGLMLAAAGELYRLARRRGAAPVPLAGFAAIGALTALAYRGSDALLVGAPGVLAAATGLTFVALIMRTRLEGALAAVSLTVAAAAGVGLLGSFVIAMRRAAFGFRVVLVFALMATLNDAAERLMRRWAAGRVDPARAGWAGAIAGAVAAAAVALVASATLDPPFRSGRALVLAGLVAVFAPAGRRFAGAVRDKAADAPTPVLDRVDGMLFAAPIFFFAYRAMVR